MYICTMYICTMCCNHTCTLYCTMHIVYLVHTCARAMYLVQLRCTCICCSTKCTRSSSCASCASQKTCNNRCRPCVQRYVAVPYKYSYKVRVHSGPNGYTEHRTSRCAYDVRRTACTSYIMHRCIDASCIHRRALGHILWYILQVSTVCAPGTMYGTSTLYLCTR